jgi:carbonic anhydrase
VTNRDDALSSGYQGAMQKLLAGIVDFRRRVRPGYAETFARLALGQAPDCLMVACADSRVVPNLFASTDPGDLFVVRNVGNFVPPFAGASARDRAAGAAVEFATQVLGVGDVVVVGHSECGAMRCLLTRDVPESAPTLKSWLSLGDPALARMGAHPDPELPHAHDLVDHDRLSQLNVLEQLRNVRTYPGVDEKVRAGALRLHAWWFDIATAEVLAWHPDAGRFDPILEPEDG